MKLIEELGRKYGHRYFKVQCLVCGHIRECGDNNISHAGIYHDIHVCKEDFIKEYIGKIYGDYKIIELDRKLRLKLQCTICNHIIYKLFNQINSLLKHTASRCKDEYYKSFIKKEFKDFIITGYFYKDMQVFFICKCKKCGIKRNVIAGRILKYNFNHRDCIKFLPSDEIKTSIARRWADILQRTNNPKHDKYKYYGGRGIKCTFKDIIEFYFYFYDKLKANPTLTIDRIDVDGNYSPENTRLVTKQEQQVNKRTTIYLFISNGKRHFLTNNISEFARFMDYNTHAVGNAIRGNRNYRDWQFTKLTKDEFKKRIKNVTTNRNINIFQEV